MYSNKQPANKISNPTGERKKYLLLEKQQIEKEIEVVIKSSFGGVIASNMNMNTKNPNHYSQNVILPFLKDLKKYSKDADYSNLEAANLAVTHLQSALLRRSYKPNYEDMIELSEKFKRSNLSKIAYNYVINSRKINYLEKKNRLTNFKKTVWAAATIAMAGFTFDIGYNNQQQVGDFFARTVPEKTEIATEQVSKSFNGLKTAVFGQENVELEEPITFARPATQAEKDRFNEEKEKLEQEQKAEAKRKEENDSKNSMLSKMNLAPVANSINQGWDFLGNTVKSVKESIGNENEVSEPKYTEINQTQFRQALELLKTPKNLIPKEEFRNDIPVITDFDGKLIFKSDRLSPVLKQKFEMKNPQLKAPTVKESQRIQTLLNIFGKLYVTIEEEIVENKRNLLEPKIDPFGSKEMMELLQDWRILVEKNGLYVININKLIDSINNTTVYGGIDTTGKDDILMEQFHAIKEEIEILKKGEVPTPTLPGLGMYKDFTSFNQNSKTPANQNFSTLDQFKQKNQTSQTSLNQE